MKKLDLIGRKFGILFVIEETDERAGGRVCWLCRCDCGNEVMVRSSSLTSGNTKSCGCVRREKSKKRLTTHGRRKTRTYKIWAEMKNRCSNIANPKYKNWGGRGITVCDRWSGENGFIHFLEDMGEAPKGLSIERTNNDLGYFKENCIWATRKQQSRNTRRNRLIEFNGKIQCLAEWVEETGINTLTLFTRLNRLGWSIEKALTTPVKKRGIKR